MPADSHPTPPPLKMDAMTWTLPEAIEPSPKGDLLVERVGSALVESGIVSPGTTVLVALSGGGDSVALLHLIWSLVTAKPIRVAAAHLNHRIRPIEAERDVEFVRELCDRIKVPLYVDVVDVPARAQKHKFSIEEAGREARMAFLERTADEIGDCVIVTGHHMDDQAETVLMRAVRGTGIGGLSAIPMVRGPYIRPLLGSRRHELQDYLKRMGVPWREDLTNADETYLRNRVRTRWLPLLAEENPKVVEALSTLAVQANETDSVIEHEASRVWKKCCQGLDQFRVVLDAKVLIRYPLGTRQRTVRRAWRHLAGGDEQPLTYRETARMTRSLESAEYCVGRGRFRAQLSRTRWMVTLDHAPPPIEGGSLVTGTPLEVWWRRILARTVEPSDILSLSESQWPGMSVIDADRVNGPLSVCPWNAGDKVLLADRSATKSVARLLSDAGVSRLERLWTPIVSDSDGIVLIFGLGEAERVKVTDKTRRGIVVSSV